MFNPILDELVALEQNKDRLREAEHHRLARAGIVRHRARRSDLRVSLGDRWIALRHSFETLARRLLRTA